MNLSQQAYKVQRQDYVEAAPRQGQVVITRRVTKGEKALWAMAGIMIFVMALLLVANQAKLYIASKDVASLQSKIDEQAKVTQQLKAESDSLSSPERIVHFAEKELGLKLDIENVKVLP
ncbi:cell division protein FtsL [Sporolactobacillus inulinus]|uniref:Cell division protein FtsL n=2 Tax=Sporolactobacillus inulinus TaxID=2078 RepID=A0A4Y3T5U4_9BACL|nr:cell division protein FtsL [Sporolactobacillus inulinus]KLI01771.1 hypothetical protein SINU_11480 [Sporolactobacillus inulinus CASD]GAY76464.1 hypothetical protein NBRC111894_2018 [Sporolactobacillus inulinus]GEB76445.1 hypothetical protein SIN01_07900 [Sporolactobacillus inulinus]